jgi:carbamoylphosphate synthase large subunit
VVGNNPSDALAKSVEDYVQVDYSDVKKTEQLLEDRNIDYLVPGCNDRSYLACAEINRSGSFPGIEPVETAEIINNKEKFKEYSLKRNLPVPRILSEDEIGSRWPIIIKPVDAFSGRGVSVIHEDKKHTITLGLKRAREASRTGRYIVEDYVEGQLYSHTAFIQDGNIIRDYIVEEHGTVNPFVVDTSRVSFDFSKHLFEQIRNEITLIATDLNLLDGLIHTQFICNESQYWLIEITRRCPGDLYSQLIELSTGFNYAENYARPFVGEPFRIVETLAKKWVMRHTLSQPTDFTLGSLSFKVPLKIVKSVPISVTGQRLRASPYGRIGVVFFEEQTEEALNNIFLTTLNRRLYSVLT